MDWCVRLEPSLNQTHAYQEDVAAKTSLGKTGRDKTRSKGNGNAFCDADL